MALGFAFLVSCDAATQSPVAGIEIKLERQRCAIGFATLLLMRKKGILPDPILIAGCPDSYASYPVDITATGNRSVVKSATGTRLYHDLLRRRVPASVADQIAASAAFADWVALANTRTALRH